MRTSLIILSLTAACGGAPQTTQSPRAVAAVAPAAPAEAPAAAPPANLLVAAIKPVTNTYHGVAVVDPYQWLEADDAAVRAWSEAHNARAREVLDGLPEIDVLRREIQEIYTAPITSYGGFAAAGGKLFGYRKQPTKEQAELIVMDDPAKPAAARLILDPAAAGGAQQSIDWMKPSPDGRKVAVSISFGGSEAGSLHIMDLDGKDLEPVIPNVQQGTGGGSAAWTPDGKGIYYTRYPAAGEKPEAERTAWMQVWYHELGTPIASDRYEMGKDLPKIAEILLASDKRGRVLATVQNGDGGEFRHYLRDKTGWRQLDDWKDRVVSIDFGPGEDLWLVSRDGAPRGKILKLAGNARTTASATVVVPEGKDALITEFTAPNNLVVIEDRLLALYQLGGPSELRAFKLDGKPAKAPTLPPVSSASLPVRWKNRLVFLSMSYTTPAMYGAFDPATGATTALRDLSQSPPVDLSGFEVVREFATSKDGTQVPLNIVWPKAAAKDGSTPCVVTGYGGFASSESPAFLGRWAPLLRRGVCMVLVNLRGGSEFGEAWHQAGAGVHKQNVFDDFAAVLRHVVERKYTSVPRLGIIGGSNGGLLMGAMIAQHPDYMHAVVSGVGIYDMLRTELSPNGAYNVTEYGTVADEAQFKALYAYSPYHHVARAAYPAILMTTGANDPRVSPWQSRKMIAALLAAQTGDAPILLRTSDKAGHGIGSSMSERIDLSAHQQAFLLAYIRP